MDVAFEEKKVKEEKLEVGDIVVLKYSHREKPYHMIVTELFGEQKFTLRDIDGFHQTGGKQGSLEELLHQIKFENNCTSYQILSKEDFGIHILPKQ